MDAATNSKEIEEKLLIGDRIQEKQLEDTLAASEQTQEIAQNLLYNASALETSLQKLRIRTWITAILTTSICSVLISTFAIWQHSQSLEKELQKTVWYAQVSESLDNYLVHELYPNLSKKRKREIDRLYRRLGLLSPKQQLRK